jgi:hypothetical protein
MGKGKSKIQDLSDTMEQMIQQALEKREKATKQIEVTRKIIDEANKLGLNTARAAALLQKAQTTLKNAQSSNYIKERPGTQPI